MCTNPLVSLPDADRVRRALDACELVVVSDCMRHTDTTRHADVLLPAPTWGEKDGTVTNSERRISRQRPFLPAPGAARADWRTVLRRRAAHGFSGFDYPNAAAIFREHAGLSSFENAGRARLRSVRPEYARRSRLRCAYPDPVAGDARISDRHAADVRNRQNSSRPDRKARFVPVTPRAAVNATSRDYPLVLNTGRVRDQWHTMTRHREIGAAAGARFRASRRIPSRRCAHGRRREWRARATVQPVGRDGGRALSSPPNSGAAACSCRCTGTAVCRRWPRQRAGQSGDRSDLRTAGVEARAVSRRQPHLPKWHAFILSRQEIDTVPEAGYWCRAAQGRCCEWNSPCDERPNELARDWARAQLRVGHDGHRVDRLSRSEGRPLSATPPFATARLEGCVVHRAPTTSWFRGRGCRDLFAEQASSPNARMSLLTGQPLDASQDVGPIVCSCFRRRAASDLFGRNRLRAASVDDAGRRSDAGTTQAPPQAGNAASCCVARQCGIRSPHERGRSVRQLTR